MVLLASALEWASPYMWLADVEDKMRERRFYEKTGPLSKLEARFPDMMAFSGLQKGARSLPHRFHW